MLTAPIQWTHGAQVKAGNKTWGVAWVNSTADWEGVQFSRVICAASVLVLLLCFSHWAPCCIATPTTKKVGRGWKENVGGRRKDKSDREDGRQWMRDNACMCSRTDSRTAPPLVPWSARPLRSAGLSFSLHQKAGGGEKNATCFCQIAENKWLVQFLVFCKMLFNHLLKWVWTCCF